MCLEQTRGDNGSKGKVPVEKPSIHLCSSITRNYKVARSQRTPLRVEESGQNVIQNKVRHFAPKPADRSGFGTAELYLCLHGMIFGNQAAACKSFSPASAG